MKIKTIKLLEKFNKELKEEEFEKSKVIKEYFSTLGKRCLKTMTKKQRVDRARKATKARWAKAKQK